MNRPDEHLIKITNWQQYQLARRYGKFHMPEDAKVEPYCIPGKMPTGDTFKCNQLFINALQAAEVEFVDIEAGSLSTGMYQRDDKS